MPLLTVAEKARVREAISAIKGSFLWDSTPQGVGYWTVVCDNLEGILLPKKTPRRCPCSAKGGCS